ncbi:lysophosphatidylcholine acyltransferase 1-like [Hippocampus zosterae]|uniref:lysophosphatidylcholine acyltransferase 1-like n=1 Tax=Hippocampus zosterae TaxID=109293 RepID=UPI00223D5A88|nr:lysophosphatidylcholine acyltransferase 1-like [Hippocampus zosterae]
MNNPSKGSTERRYNFVDVARGPELHTSSTSLVKSRAQKERDTVSLTDQPVHLLACSFLFFFSCCLPSPSFKILWLTLCQPHNAMEIEYLPVYTPSDEEKENPTLFASNVRKLMAKALGVPLADLSFEDRDITFSEGPLRIRDPSGLLEFNRLVRRLGVKITNGLLKEQASRARKLLRHQLNLEDLACFLHLPVTNTLREVTSLFIQDEEGHIDIRHFVIAMSTIYRPSRSMETLKLAFEMYENEDSGEVHEDELASTLEIMLGVKEVELSVFFMELDGADSGKITYDKLYRFIEQHPRFVHDYLDFQDHPRRSCIRRSDACNGQSHDKDN